MSLLLLLSIILFIRKFLCLKTVKGNDSVILFVLELFFATNSYKVLLEALIFLLPLLVMFICSELVLVFELSWFFSWWGLVSRHLLLIISRLDMPPVIVTQRLKLSVLLNSTPGRLDVTMVSWIIFFNWVFSCSKSCRLHVVVDAHSADGKNSSRHIGITLIHIWLSNILLHRLRTVSYGLSQIVVSLRDLRLTRLFTLWVWIWWTASLNANQVLGLLDMLVHRRLLS